MGIRIIRPKVDEFRRILVISDIHGNYEVFHRLLQKLRYTRNDILVLLGNLVERGPESLKTLRYVIELSKTNPVYTLMGDVDPICREIMRNDRNQELLRYALNTKHSLVGDMCREAGIPLRLNTNMLLVKQSLRVIYQQELEFLMNLPHLMELPNFIFSHAQILPGALEELTPAEVIRGDAFLNKGFSFEKYVVVGHWPVLLYDTHKRDANPIINRNRKIISINGGISRKRDGQLNALIIPNSNSFDFRTEYEDGLPKGRVLNSQFAGEFRNTICWPDNQVKPLRYSGDFAYCRHESSNSNFWIPKSFLSERDGIWRTEDVTDYQLKVTYEDVVSVVEDTSRGYLVKKDGITGWYYGMLEFDGV